MRPIEVAETRVRARDRIAVWAFGLFWLLPVIAIGVTRRPPPLPAALVELSNVTCLFTRAQPTWTAFYVLVRTRPGGPWIELDTRPDFELEPFGHRTRLDRYLIEWSDRRGARGREELAQWLMQEHERRSPGEPPIVELSFVAASIGVRPGRPPSGRWVRPRMTDVPPNHRRVLSTHARRSDS